MTKRKVEERMKEHISDLKLDTPSIASARKNRISSIKLETLKIENISNYGNM